MVTGATEAVKSSAGVSHVARRSDRGPVEIAHEDGAEGEIGPGEAYVIEPGHDAWVVGDETFVGFEFESPTAEVYAKG